MLRVIQPPAPIFMTGSLALSAKNPPRVYGFDQRCDAII
jgi:hypothetical protein